MDYWHIQMHLPYGRGNEQIDSAEMIRGNNPVIGTGEWPNVQCRQFKGEGGGLKVEDIIMVREGNKPLALCEITSDCFADEDLTNKYGHQWYRYVRVLDWNEKNEINSNFSQGTLKILYERSNTPSWKYINEWHKKIKSMGTIKGYTKLLQANKNLILTGAPGTGKTYLAKQIALQLLFEKSTEDDLSPEEKGIFKEHYGFVQFHPSYDYTDFVEGLRPIKQEENIEIGFELKNGVFKTFCKKAIKQKDTNNFDEKYDQFITDLLEESISLETPQQKNKFEVEINSNNSCFAIPSAQRKTRLSLTKKMIRDYVETGIIKSLKPYLTPVGNYFKEHYPLDKVTRQQDDKPYIFVIDEINRGEISKIFGELFFSIDPGYRGINGKVQTQYTNIQSDDTIFDSELGQGWFYVPENVYIIGTMNDIDRSVESFDFAMRRRFTWREITAEESAKNMGLSDESKDRMNSLNEAISQIEGLNSSYHIGGAYFLNNGNPDFAQLWELRLQPLLKEYLRGMSDIDGLLSKLKEAYDLERNTNENNG
jgi:hypothetical protein